jgi:hypothetical protein
MKLPTSAPSALCERLPACALRRAWRRIRAVSSDSARRWLWIAALATMPVPFFLLQMEWAPVLRLAFLTSLYTAVMLAEGGEVAILMGALGIVQTLLYTGLFFLAAGFAARGVERIGSPPMRVAAVGTAVFLLVASAQLPIYETPLSSARARSNLWQLFD